MDTLGVDWIRNPSAPQATITKLDFSWKEGQQIIRDMLYKADVGYMHASILAELRRELATVLLLSNF